MNALFVHSSGVQSLTRFDNLRRKLTLSRGDLTGVEGRCCAGRKYISQHAMHAGNHVTTKT